MVAVRSATAADAQPIRQVHLAAFPTAAEADLVRRLEESGDALVSLVADDDGTIVGHVLFSRMDVEADDRVCSAMALAPVAVMPQLQGSGIGSALVHAGLRLAEARGADIVFVLGDAGFYQRFGFDAATAANFVSPYSGPHFQALILNPRLRPPKWGRATHAAAFGELRS